MIPSMRLKLGGQAEVNAGHAFVVFSEHGSTHWEGNDETQIQGVSNGPVHAPARARQGRIRRPAERIEQIGPSVVHKCGKSDEHGETPDLAGGASGRPRFEAETKAGVAE